MRIASFSRIVVGLVGALGLWACKPKDLVDGVVALASLPKVCPSGVRAILEGGRIGFHPLVENRGVNDSNTSFRVYTHVTIGTAGSFRNLVYVGPNGPMVGTHGVSGVSAGPNVELTTVILNPGTSTFTYDPQQTYGVTLTISSTDDTFNTANQDCQWFGPVSFKGGEPL